MSGRSREPDRPVPLVCILSAGVEPGLAGAIASARRFELPILIGQSREPVLVGQSRGSEGAAPPAGAEVVSIEWRDDFAAARNALADIARARHGENPYLLWLDSDEEITSWPERDWSAETAPWWLLQIQDSAALTPRPIARLQRNDGSLRWRYAIHEMLESTAPHGSAAPELLPGEALCHHGYESDEAIAAKIKRNHRIVAAERRRGRDYLYLWVEEARYAAAFGTGAAMAWSKVFNHPDAAPRQPGGIDLRVEAAEALCEFGSSAPAEQLLNSNPLILSLHLAILRGQTARGENIDAERLNFVAQCTSKGLGDSRYSYPRAILGATREAIMAFVAQSAEAANDGKKAPGATAPGRNDEEGGMDGRFMQNENFDAEILGEDLVLMNNETREVLTLNPTARAVWEALDGRPSIDEIAEAFEGVFPDIDKAALRRDIIQTIEHFLASGLASETGDAA